MQVKGRDGQATQLKMDADRFRMTMSLLERVVDQEGEEQ
jgi:hypothetical protein